MPSLPAGTYDPEGDKLASHCVHQIRTLLQLGHNGENGATICVSGPGVGSGKTSLSRAIGLSFGYSGTRTLLVDGDLTGRELTRADGADAPGAVCAPSPTAS